MKVARKLQFVTAKEFKKRQEKGTQKKVGVRKGFALGSVKRVDEGNDGLVLRLTISTDALDRDGDTIAVDGWDLKDYNKNPVVLWSHSHIDPPVGKSLKVWVEDAKLKSDARFTPHDLNPFGHMVGRLYEEGYMRATSVGFLPLEWDEAEERDGGDSFYMPIDFKRQTLLEYSAVPVPSNPEALADAKAKGVVDLSPMIEWAERVLDEAGEGDKGLWVPRKTVESIYKLLSPRKSVNLPAKTSVQESKNEDAHQARAGAPQTNEAQGEGKEPGEPLNGDSVASGEAVSEPVDEKTGEGKSEEIRDEKAGRSLSKANEDRLKRARDLIDEVLASVGTDDDDEKDSSAAEKGGPDRDEVILELAPDEPSNEPNNELDIDPDDIAEMIQRAVKDNLNRIRGRVD